jgi:hypothetical protein
MKVPAHRTLCAALRTTATFREFITKTQGRSPGWRIDTYARMIDIELTDSKPRRSVVRKLFTTWAALSKKRDWATLEGQL